MPDMSLIRERLLQIEESLNRIQRRFASIKSHEDFTTTEENLDRLDAIAMMLIAIGESFKKIDYETDGEWLVKYSEIDWHGVIGLRNVLAHNYFDIDSEIIFKICHEEIQKLLNTVRRMLKDI